MAHQAKRRSVSSPRAIFTLNSQCRLATTERRATQLADAIPLNPATDIHGKTKILPGTLVQKDEVRLQFVMNICQFSLTRTASHLTATPAHRSRPAPHGYRVALRTIMCTSPMTMASRCAPCAAGRRPMCALTARCCNWDATKTAASRRRRPLGSRHSRSHAPTTRASDRRSSGRAWRWRMWC